MLDKILAIFKNDLPKMSSFMHAFQSLVSHFEDDLVQDNGDAKRAAIDAVIQLLEGQK